MDFEEIKEKGSRYLFQNYGRIDLSFTHGEGMRLYDTEGREYLDLVAGIAVNALGYAHPRWVAAVQAQAARLCHVSNLYHVAEQAEAAEKLASVTPKGLDRTLFVNSGAEANEGAMKLAVRSTGRRKVLSALNSFHGRTSAALGATGQEKYRDSFQPLIGGCFGYYEYNSCESVKSMVDRDTAAVLVEPIQGEGGVVPATREFLRTVRDVCTDAGALMVADEVQTGIGRTGRWFGMEDSGAVPDVMSCAKALGGGVPVGAVVTTAELSEALPPGTHGTTFGGGPLVSAAVSATIDIIKDEGLVENAARVGRRLLEGARSVGGPRIRDVRGRGLMVGIEMEGAAEFQAHCRERGVLVNVCHGDVVRLIPPLIISDADADRFLSLLRGHLAG